MAERSNGAMERRPLGDDTPLNHSTEGSRGVVGSTSSASQPALHEELNIQSNVCGESHISVEKLLLCITEELKECDANIPENRDGKPFIFRVPDWLRNNDETAYAPRLFSFGPYHHSNQNLPHSEHNKLCYVRDANIRFKKEIMEDILKSRKKARSCYDEDINMDDKDFVLMLFRDACCLLQAFGAMSVPCEVANRETADTGIGNEQGINSSRFLTELYRDIVLLENQVPFFILRMIHEVEYDATDETCMLNKAVAYVHHIMRYLSPGMTEPCVLEKNIHHFLHLCHIYLSPRRVEEAQPNNNELISQDENEMQGHRAVEEYREEGVQLKKKELSRDETEIQWHRAVEYREAGVQLRKKELSRHRDSSLLDIEFKNGMLLIPCFVIDEKVNYIFRNLLAFEQCSECTNIPNHVTAYITFMSHLVNKPEDVALLCEKGIIENHIGGEEDVSRLFISLSRQLIFDPKNQDYYLKSLSVRLDKHYKSRVSTWWAWLRHKHNNPWLILGAIFVLLTSFSTLVQLVHRFLNWDK